VKSNANTFCIMFSKIHIDHHLSGICTAFLFLLLVTGCYNPDYHFVSNITSASMYKIETNQEIKLFESYGKSSRGKIGEIAILVLRGTNEEIGEAHGALAGKDIISLLDTILIPYVNKIQLNGWDSKVVPLSKSFRFPENYEKELNAIFCGIEKRYPDKKSRTLTSVKREISIDDLRALNCFIDLYLSRGGCSSFSAWGSLTVNGEVICGRNLDERYIPGKPPLMIVARQPSELNRQASIEITGPGLIGVSTAMNADGLMLMGHDEQGLKSISVSNWVPRAIVLREAIEAVRTNDSIDKITGIFKNRSVRLGNNTHIALPIPWNKTISPAFVIEWDGNPQENGATYRVVDQFVTEDALVCTNHFVKRRLGALVSAGNSRVRFKLLADFLLKCRASKKTIDVDAAIRMMDLVAEGGETVTYLSVIAVPSERRLILAISPGQGISATKAEWIELTWDQIFRAL
jgi:hypothetical protein